MTFCVFTVETCTELRDLVCKFMSPNSIYKTALGLSIYGTVKVTSLARERVETDHRTKLAKVYGSQHGGSVDLEVTRLFLLVLTI